MIDDHNASLTSQGVEHREIILMVTHPDLNPFQPLIKRLIFEKRDVFKKWQICLGPKLKRQQTCENNSELTLEIFKTKNRLKND